ncbi:MAG TPA: helix-turn-helix domain-containing protein [Thermoguttaceae bacterium]|nr:helix-turn-helix domain-containing protein [Thermoguttaceae bacterium]
MTSRSDNSPARTVTKEDLEAILDSLVEGIVTLDDERKIIGINRAACEILEVEKGQAVEADCCELMGKQLCESAAAVADSIRDGKPLSDFQVQVQTRSGRKKVLVFQTNTLRGPEDRRRGSVVVLRDVTELAALKEDLARRPHEVEPAKDAARPSGPQAGAVEPEAVRDVLEATGWNVARAARRLRVSRTTLYKRIAALGIRRPDE